MAPSRGSVPIKSRRLPAEFGSDATALWRIRDSMAGKFSPWKVVSRVGPKRSRGPWLWGIVIKELEEPGLAQFTRDKVHVWRVQREAISPVAKRTLAYFDIEIKMFGLLYDALAA